MRFGPGLLCDPGLLGETLSFHFLNLSILGLLQTLLILRPGSVWVFFSENDSSRDLFENIKAESLKCFYLEQHLAFYSQLFGDNFTCIKHLWHLEAISSIHSHVYSICGTWVLWSRHMLYNALSCFWFGSFTFYCWTLW